MALLNNGNTDYIQANSNRSDSFTTMTLMAWIKLNTLQETYIARFGAARNFAFHNASTDEVYLGIARATQASNYITTDFNATTGTWYFVAAVYNEDNTVWGGGQAIELATGTVTSLATQRTSTAQAGLTGSGSTTALSNDTVYVTNRDNNDTRRLDGDIAFYAYFGSELSLEQIQSIQFDPLAALKYSPATLLIPGLASATACPDWSGNGDHFTATNMTISAHLPLPIFAQRHIYTEIPAAPPAGRTTKNTDSNPLGIHTGMAWRINQP